MPRVSRGRRRESALRDVDSLTVALNLPGTLVAKCGEARNTTPGASLPEFQRLPQGV